MTVSGLNFRDSFNAVKAARRIVNPNLGFQKQLQKLVRLNLQIIQFLNYSLFF
jgi:hypothetical protein